MFPDPTLRWRPYPSIIDGIERPPFVFDQGLWRGVLYLIVVAPNPGLRAYGIEMSCEVYSGIEEMIYSVADHGAKTGSYAGKTVKSYRPCFTAYFNLGVQRLPMHY